MLPILTPPQLAAYAAALVLLQTVFWLLYVRPRFVQRPGGHLSACGCVGLALALAGAAAAIAHALASRLIPARCPSLT